jgi:hypothetical protein
MAKSRKQEVRIGPDLVAAIMALPDRVSHSPGIQWTDKMDEALLAGWPTKPHELVAEKLGVSVGTAQRRYRLLMKGTR